MLPIADREITRGRRRGGSAQVAPGRPAGPRPCVVPVAAGGLSAVGATVRRSSVHSERHILLPRGPLRPEEVGLRYYEVMLILPAEADESVVGTAVERI